jgi:hypothetical protein
MYTRPDILLLHSSRYNINHCAHKLRVVDNRIKLWGGGKEIIKKFTDVIADPKVDLILSVWLTRDYIKSCTEF